MYIYVYTGEIVQLLNCATQWEACPLLGQNAAVPHIMPIDGDLSICMIGR